MDKPSLWGFYATKLREPVAAWSADGKIFVTVGGNPSRVATCSLDLRTSVIRRMSYGADIPVPGTANRLELRPWLHSGMPVLRLHPFALADLYVTEQVPRDVVMECITAIGMSASGVSYSQPLVVDCQLVRALRAYPILRFTSDCSDPEVTSS